MEVKSAAGWLPYVARRQYRPEILEIGIANWEGAMFSMTVSTQYGAWSNVIMTARAGLLHGGRTLHTVPKVDGHAAPCESERAAA